MKRLTIAALAALLVATPAFAQSGPPAPNGGASPLLTDQAGNGGMSALAQQSDDQQSGPLPSPLLIAGGMAGVTTLMGVLIVNSQNINKAPVSP